jgi:hypothetical protein
MGRRRGEWVWVLTSQAALDFANYNFSVVEQLSDSCAILYVFDLVSL